MRVKAGLSLGLLLLATMGLTGCGGSDKDPGVATANGSATPSSSATGDTKGEGDDQEKALQYAKCMRENGVPDFADPEPGDGGGFKMMLPEGVTPESIEGAQEKCKQYMPSGGSMKGGGEDPEAVEKQRKFAQCMRDNGIPRYPDPQAGGGPVKRDADTFGMDPRDPKFKAAEEKCAEFRPKPPGGSTPQQTVSGAGA